MFGFFLLFSLFVGSYGVRHYLNSPIEEHALNSLQSRSNDVPITDEPSCYDPCEPEYNKIRDLYGKEAVVLNLTTHQDFLNLCSACKGYDDCSVYHCGEAFSGDGTKRISYALIEIGCANMDVFEEDHKCDVENNYSAKLNATGCQSPFLQPFFALPNGTKVDKEFVNENYCKPAIETVKCEYKVLKPLCNDKYPVAELNALSLQNIIKRYLVMKGFKETPTECEALYDVVQKAVDVTNFNNASRDYTPPATIITTTIPTTTIPTTTTNFSHATSTISGNPLNILNTTNATNPVSKPGSGNDSTSVDPTNIATSMPEASTVLGLTAAIVCAVMLA